MEIVHIVRQYKPSVGGLEDAVQNLCLHLSRREGIKVRIITLNRVFSEPETVLPEHEMIDGISITRLSYFGSKRYPIALSVLSEIQSANLIHVHAIDFFFDFLALTRFIHNKPLVASTHGGFFHTSFASTLKKVYFQTITRSSCLAYKTLCASSENDAATFRQIAPAYKVMTLENGVNIDKWKNAASAVLLRTMIFIGRWSDNKAVPMLIELVLALKQQGADWSLIIVGIPAHETVESLRACAERLNVSSQVHIYVKPDVKQILNLINQASYIASASTYEGFGISIVEGLSAGLIPLVSPIPPFKKLLAALETGEIIDTNQLKQSATQIESLHCSLLSDFVPIKEKCIDLAKQYDWSGVTDRTVDVYRKVMSNNI